MSGESNPPELRGIIPLSFQHIFNHIATTTDSVKTSSLLYVHLIYFLAIYGQGLIHRDLQRKYS